MMGTIILGWLIFALAIVVAGIVTLLLSRRFMEKGAPARRVLGIVAAGMIFSGAVLAVGPTIILGQSIYYGALPPEDFVVTDIPVENWSDGRFTANGVVYQMLGLEFNVLASEAWVGQAEFTYDEPSWANDSRNLNFYSVKNSMGFDFYWPNGYLYLYCAADQAEQAAQYYQSADSGRAFYVKNNGLHPVDEALTLTLEKYLSTESFGTALPFSFDSYPQADGFDLLHTSGDGLFVMEEYSFLFFDGHVYFVPNGFDSETVVIHPVPDALGQQLLAICRN